jgi:hypothetical protein
LAYEGWKVPRVRDRSISLTRPVGKRNDDTCTFDECISKGHGNVMVIDRERGRREWKKNVLDRQKEGVFFRKRKKDVLCKEGKEELTTKPSCCSMKEEIEKT